MPARDGDYSPMAPYYDTIMQAGYYDYGAIAAEILALRPLDSILELGCGSGLIIERLMSEEPPARCVGVDHTAAMLELAKSRVGGHPDVQLQLGDVRNLPVQEEFDVVFSYGGPWYFSHVEDRPVLISHVIDPVAMTESLELAAASVAFGGSLLLGVQGPHSNYRKGIGHGLVYEQQIEESDSGFVKRYYLFDEDRMVMSQELEYRVVDAAEIRQMIKGFGLEEASPGEHDGLFTRFVRS